MQLLPPSPAAPPVFHSRSFTLAHDGKVGAVDDEMKWSLGRNSTECEVELLTSAVSRVEAGIGTDWFHRGRSAPRGTSRRRS